MKDNVQIWNRVDLKLIDLPDCYYGYCYWKKSTSESYPDPDNNDSDEVDGNHSDISGVQRQAGAGGRASGEATGAGSCNTDIHKAGR